MTALIAAKRYADLGLSVIPIKPMEKVPDVTRWQQYMKRRATDKEIEDWFSTDSRNMAVVTGSVSGGLFVLDFDDPRAYMYFFSDAAELPKHTFVTETGKGVHVWARAVGGDAPKTTTFHRRGKAKTWFPLDIKAEGGYVLVPPSVHPSGKAYRFLGDAKNIMESRYAVFIDQAERRAEEWPFIERCLKDWTEGSRHVLMLGLAKILLFRVGFDAERVEDVVRRFCRLAGDDEVDERIRGVRTTIAKGAEESAAAEHLGEDLYADLMKLVPTKKKSSSSGTSEHAKYVTGAMETYAFATTMDTGEIFVYEGGVYRVTGEVAIRSWVEARHREREETAMNNFCNEIVHAVRRRTYVPRSKFNPEGRIALGNGVLDLEKLGLVPHSPDVMFTVQLPVTYDPGATCPAFLKFLAEILPDEQARTTIQRLFGYCLQLGNPYQLAFMFVGGGDNGKTTLLGVLADLLGKDAISTETLQRLSDNKFAAANLWGRLANIAADLPSKAVESTGVFKMLTGGDRMVAERKFHDAFTFVNGAKIVCSCNELPEINDKSYAFWRRWKLVEFPVDFTGREDRGLPGKLRAELSGILNWVIEGLRELRTAGEFPRGTDADALKETWKRCADSLYWFTQEGVEADPDGWVAKADFYESYATFSEANEVRVKKGEVVGKELRNHIPSVRVESHRIDGKAIRGWAGIRLVEVPDPASPESPASPVPGQARLDAGDASDAGIHSTLHVDVGHKVVAAAFDEYEAGPALAAEAFIRLRADPAITDGWLARDLIRQHGFPESRLGVIAELVAAVREEMP